MGDFLLGKMKLVMEGRERQRIGRMGFMCWRGGGEGGAVDGNAVWQKRRGIKKDRLSVISLYVLYRTSCLIVGSRLAAFPINLASK